MNGIEHRLRMGDLPLNTKAEIVALDDGPVTSALLPGELERRLIEMGLVEGAHVEVLHEAFPGRDPIAVRVDEHTVALRRAEANAVIVVARPSAGDI